MSEFFLNIVNMSISASWIVLAVLLLRLLLKKAPKWITVLLWGIVAVRLICPFTIESVMSLIPSAETISPEIMMDATPEINSGIPILNNTINPVISESFSPDPATSANPLQILIPILSVLWVVGIAGMLLYTVVSYFRVKRKIDTAVLLRDNVFQSENVVSPFVLGIIKPKVYLPFSINEPDMSHVIAHEQAHISRKDHFWKPIGFLLLTIHWFNPLMWLGYILLCRDIELACDEKVIKELNTEQKADYSQALLTCSVNRRMIAACPLAFGEVGVKNRVKSVLNYKKPAFWIIVIAIIASVVTAICFLTNPQKSIDDELSVFLDTQIAEYHYSEGHTNDNFIAISQKVLDVDKSSEETTVYMWVLYHEYIYENGAIQLKAGAHIPTVITVKREGSHGHYKLVEYWTPRDGSYYAKDIKAKFPWYLHGKALDSQRYIGEQKAFCENAAREYFNNASNINSSEKLTWTYQPMLSFTGHSFKGFLFDFDYTHVDASCTGGELCSLDVDGQPYGTKMRFENENTVYWTPKEAVIERIPQKSEVTLEIYNDETQVHKCTVVFECVSRDTASAVFEIYLKVSDGLQMVSTDTAIKLVEQRSISNVGGVDTPVNMVVTVDMDQLKSKFPNYFGLTTSKGLEVYIWQMAEGSYSCGLLPGKNLNYTQEELWNLHKSSASLDEMRAIIADYMVNGNVSKSDIVIRAIGMPHSSYAYTIDDEYRRKLNELFWSEIPIVENTKYSPIIDTATFDIDGDGKNEQCSLSYGPTSGLFTFILSVSENGKLEYYNIYNGLAGEMSFETTTAGTKLHLVPQGESGPIDYSFSIKDGNIVLTANGENVAYWGEQGVNSKYAPTQISDLNTAITKVLNEKYRAEKPDGLIHIENYYLLANETASGTPLKGNSGHMEIANVYLLVYHMKYSVNGGQLEEHDGGFVPTAITFAIDKNGEYTLEDYWIPQTGTNFEKDVRNKFPGSSAAEALNTEKYAKDLIKENWRLANEAFSKTKR